MYYAVNGFIIKFLLIPESLVGDAFEVFEVRGEPKVL